MRIRKFLAPIHINMINRLIMITRQLVVSNYLHYEHFSFMIVFIKLPGKKLYELLRQLKTTYKLRSEFCRLFYQFITLLL